MKITSVRHGQTVENANKITMGQLGGTLSDLGKQQAREAAEQLKLERFDYVYCSDLDRCRQTADPIMAYHRETPIEYTKGLREMHFGDFQGKFAFTDKWDELPGSFVTRRAPNGENGIEFQTRIITFVNELLQKHSTNHLLLITHGGVMKSLKANIEGLDYETTIRSNLDNCAILEYEIKKPLIMRVE